MALEKYKACIDVCAHCASECDACSSQCILDEGRPACAMICMETARACWHAASSLSRMSPLSAETCEFCAIACDACARVCEKHADEHTQSCARACRDCAEECRKLAGIETASGRIV